MMSVLWAGLKRTQSFAVGLVALPMIQFVSWNRFESQDPEFQKEYLKLIGERMKMEKLVREFP